jgi:PIN domain nuclease of toxin-antitoxin system
MLEAQMLYAEKRLELPLPFAHWLARATDERMPRVLPLDREVVVAVDELPAKFPGDPADRLIAATARAHALPLASRDTRQRRSGLVRVWKP